MVFTWAPLTGDNFADLDELFARPGGHIVKQCYCVWFRERGGAGQIPNKERRPFLLKLAQGDLPPGILGYEDGVVVGWASLGPRHDFVRLERSRVMKQVDDQPVWSLPCFFVDREWRGRGMATQLLKAAQEFAIANNAETLEAYPVDRSDRTPPDSAFYGLKTMFDKEGFVEVARHKPTRAIVRKNLGSHQ
jgi:GNAT superfamily N-acetyltransferase